MSPSNLINYQITAVLDQVIYYLNPLRNGDVIGMVVPNSTSVGITRFVQDEASRHRKLNGPIGLQLDCIHPIIFSQMNDCRLA
ncbi:catenin beta [Ahrensia sp. R2A130]|nr:catenin beta [Ahrensia sp. R2A130]